MSRPLRWSNLTLGLIVLVVVIALTTLALLSGKLEQLRGSTSTLYMVTNTATGVLDGTEVWLGGQKVGVVRDVRFRTVSSDTAERLIIEMAILSDYVDHIRKDSDVQLRPGSGLIGAPVVFITVGTTNAPSARAGDTLRAQPQLVRRSHVSDIGALGDSVIAAATTFGQLKSQVSQKSVEIAQLQRETQRQITTVENTVEGYAHRTTRSSGTISRLLADTVLRRAVAHADAQADSVRTLLLGTNHSFGRFRRDSTIFPAARHILAQIDTLRAGLGRYTVVPQDTGPLAVHLQQTRAQLDSLVSDAKRHPFKYFSL